MSSSTPPDPAGAAVRAGRDQPDQEPLLENASQSSVGERETPSSSESTEPQGASWRSSLTSSLAALKRAFSRRASDMQRVGTEDDDPLSAQAADVEGGQPSSSSSAASRAASGEIQDKPGSPKALGRTGSREREKVCLICLEVLSPEDFSSGRAIALECNCRGDLALRHKECAVKWAQVKGDLICELCKAPVSNLPALPPRPPETVDDTFLSEHQAMMDLTPTAADLVFDCIRVTWVAMIVSILFFEMSLGAALWTGLIAGLAYSFMVRLMYRQHWAAMQRLAEQQQQAAAALQQQAQQQRGAGGPPPQVQVVITSL